MRYFALFLTITFIALFSSCGSSVNEKDVSTKEVISSTNDDTPVRENKERIEEISSFDFIKNGETDNFYFKDHEAKTIKITNLIPVKYEINSDNELQMVCIAYSPETKKYQSFYHDYDCNPLNFKLGNDIIEWNKSPNTYAFIIKLANAKDVKQIPFYDGTKDKKSIRDLMSVVPSIDANAVAINVQGVFKKGKISYVPRAACTEFINNSSAFEFESSVFEIVKSSSASPQ